MPNGLCGAVGLLVASPATEVKNQECAIVVSPYLVDKAVLEI